MGKERESSVIRPSTTNQTKNEDLLESRKLFRVDLASRIVGIFAEARRIPSPEDDGEIIGLTPKEEATYAAALSRLELFFDEI